MFVGSTRGDETAAGEVWRKRKRRGTKIINKAWIYKGITGLGN